MDYSLLISIFAFAAAAELSSKYNTKPMTNSAIAVLIPFAVSVFTKWITGFPIWSLGSILLVIVQFVAALIVFRGLWNDESFSGWLAWTIGGLVLVVFIIPSVFSRLLGFL